jgi:hypothetical protein
MSAGLVISVIGALSLRRQLMDRKQNVLIYRDIIHRYTGIRVDKDLPLHAQPVFVLPVPPGTALIN